MTESSSPGLDQAQGPTPEDLNAGYEMYPGEKLTMETKVTGRQKVDIWRGPAGQEFSGVCVARLNFSDGKNPFAEAAIINRGPKGMPFIEDMEALKHIPADLVLAIYPGYTKDPIIHYLEPGQPWGVGRDFEGQDELPDSVAGRQCVIGIDEQDLLTIENLDAPGKVVVQTFTK